MYEWYWGAFAILNYKRLLYLQCIHVYALVCDCGGTGKCGTFIICNTELTIAPFQRVVLRVLAKTVHQSEAWDICTMERKGIFGVLGDIHDRSREFSVQFSHCVTAAIDSYTRRVVTSGKELHHTSLPCRTVWQGVPIWHSVPIPNDIWWTTPASVDVGCRQEEAVEVERRHMVKY